MSYRLQKRCVREDNGGQCHTHRSTAGHLGAVLGGPICPMMWLQMVVSSCKVCAQANTTGNVWPVVLLPQQRFSRTPARSGKAPSWLVFAARRCDSMGPVRRPSSSPVPHVPADSASSLATWQGDGPHGESECAAPWDWRGVQHARRFLHALSSPELVASCIAARQRPSVGSLLPSCRRILGHARRPLTPGSWAAETAPGSWVVLRTSWLASWCGCSSTAEPTATSGASYRGPRRDAF